MAGFLQTLTAPNATAPAQQRGRRFLTIMQALMEEVTYSVVDVEQFNMQYGRRTVITFKSVITGAEQIRVIYNGYKAESKWTSYNFEFHH